LFVGLAPRQDDDYIVNRNETVTMRALHADVWNNEWKVVKAIMGKKPSGEMRALSAQSLH